MNLIIDIGNSSVKLAVFDGQKMIHRKRVMDDVINHVANLVDEFNVNACVLSVVGQSQPNIEGALKTLVPQVLHVTGCTATPLTCDYHSPETLGADRLAAAVGAAYCCPASDLLIVDVGTCVTYDYVSADGRYLGGNISPGVGMRLVALHEQTARLPLVSAEGPLPTIGGNTTEAIRIGVLKGIDYEINGYIRQMLRQHPQARIFLTGGNGYRFAKELEVERNDALVEIGLNCILQHQTR